MLIQDAIESIRGDVPGCPEPEVIKAYRNALIEFCKRTRVMTAWVNTTTAAMAVATISADQQVLDILDAQLQGQDINIVGLNDRDLTTATDEEPVLTWRNPNLPQIVPQPATSLDVQMLMVFAPGPAATTVDDAVWLRYSEDLEHGALARLMAKPGAAYSKPDVAAYHRSLFVQAMDRSAGDGSQVKRIANKLRTQKSAI